VKELEQEGQRLQELAHQHVFDGAPADDIVRPLTPSIAQAAREAGVDVVARQALHTSDRVVTLDRTDAVAATMRPGEQARTLMKQMRERP
jgi:hypothetical protein